MPGPYCYEYPRPQVTVDLVVFTLDGGKLKTLLIRRRHDPFAGKWAIPGGFLDMDEAEEAAARRELKEETGLEIEGPVEPIGFFGRPGRDPRGRTITLAFAALLPPARTPSTAVTTRPRRRGSPSTRTRIWRSTTLRSGGRAKWLERPLAGLHG